MVDVASLENLKETERVRREIVQLSKCDHKNIVRYYGSWYEFEENGNSSNSQTSLNTDYITSHHSLQKRMFICMELCDDNLANWLKLPNNIRKSLRIEKKITCDLISAVEYIHSKNIIHRDIKPSNILTNNVRGKLEVKISDFGSAKEINKHDTNNPFQSVIYTTANYAAPEIYTKNYSFPVDIYSLGLVIFQIFGFFESPDKFFNDLFAYHTSHMFPEDIKKQFPFMENIIKRMISKNPQERPTAVDLKTNDELFPNISYGNGPSETNNLLQLRHHLIQERDHLVAVKDETLREAEELWQNSQKWVKKLEETIKDLENRVNKLGPY